jgi:hypothetical protein
MARSEGLIDTVNEPATVEVPVQTRSPGQEEPALPVARCNVHVTPALVEPEITFVEFPAAAHRINTSPTATVPVTLFAPVTRPAGP